jgi:para-aminobenzoate synthetase
MTGAPKIRTMQIIDELEPCARGVYSGCLGYLSFAGTLDMSVVIRTLTSRAGQHAIGSGGAITVLSDPLAELAELELKAEPILRALSAPAL